MVLASALMRGIHPLKIFKMADVQGGNVMPLISALAEDHGVSILMTNRGVAAVPLFWLSLSHRLS